MNLSPKIGRSFVLEVINSLLEEYTDTDVIEKPEHSDSYVLKDRLASLKINSENKISIEEFYKTPTVLDLNNLMSTCSLRLVFSDLMEREVIYDVWEEECQLRLDVTPYIINFI